MENFWAHCLLRFEQELSAQQYNTWIKPLKARVNGQSVQIIAPNKFVMQWVKSKFFNRIESMAHGLSQTATVELIVDDSEHPPALTPEIKHKPANAVETVITEAVQKSSSKQPVKAHAKPLKQERTSGLNNSFLFDNYVTGRENQ